MSHGALDAQALRRAGIPPSSQSPDDLIADRRQALSAR
jgi:hypothetical protein